MADVPAAVECSVTVATVTALPLTEPVGAAENSIEPLDMVSGKEPKLAPWVMLTRL
jgi:hypothetical protein